LVAQAVRRNWRFDVERRVAELEAAARREWGAMVLQFRWTYFVRLSWAHPVSEITAAHHLDLWVARLRARIGGAVYVGLHTTPFVHAHALIYWPRVRGVPIPANPTPEAWPRGLVRGYSGGIMGTVGWSDFSHGPSAEHGSAVYTARHPGNAMLYGQPVAYQPRRKRR
jgi:hypothetical protein